MKEPWWVRFYYVLIVFGFVLIFLGYSVIIYGLHALVTKVLNG